MCVPLTASTGPLANRVTLQDLIRRYNLTDVQLNSEIVDSDTPKMALCFDDVEIYSNVMGLAPAEQANVNMLYHREGTQTAIMKCLKIWKQHDSSRATYRALLDIALSLEKGDTAHQICRQLTQRKYMCISAPPPLPPSSRKQLSTHKFDSCELNTHQRSILWPQVVCWIYTREK